jgi:hypothetical protein
LSGKLDAAKAEAVEGRQNVRIALVIEPADSQPRKTAIRPFAMILRASPTLSAMPILSA